MTIDEAEALIAQGGEAASEQAFPVLFVSIARSLERLAVAAEQIHVAMYAQPFIPTAVPYPPSAEGFTISGTQDPGR